MQYTILNFPIISYEDLSRVVKCFFFQGWCCNKITLFDKYLLSYCSGKHEWCMSNIDGLVKERLNSIANALGFRLFCTKPFICICHYLWEHMWVDGEEFFMVASAARTPAINPTILLSLPPRRSIVFRELLYLLYTGIHRDQCVGKLTARLYLAFVVNNFISRRNEKNAYSSLNTPRWDR